MTEIESTGKKVEGKIDDELVKPGEGREPIVTLETNDTHAESGEGQAKGVNQSAAELFDDGDAVVSEACHDDLEVVCQLCVPPLEMEESFNLWALTDCANDKLEKLRGRMAANLPNENEAELDKKLAKLKWWLGLIEQLRSGMLVAPEEPVDWEVLEFADEAMVDAAKRRHEKLIQWRGQLAEETVVLGNADVVPVASLVQPKRFISKKSREIEAVLACLAENGYEPLALPVVSGKQRGAKAKVREKIGRIFTSKSAFDARWKQMKRDGHIADVKSG